ncbi:MAG: Cyclopropane-fatty-acyl-phospholipid synthase [uncultured Thiotrichaceae bacterium]|uniref:Cyclopropane-fatty-acyl-phospholipid synthase n=1 Tax=uncultured Thiotrichaceae bacterium TaxID=298394 RepID=A0A6S6U4M5_9GAMM|nr:MAG: Cyclopropane-fatty-acyl-phospholipid synthase [uncultured Thiotrichaceae bacterium]
MCSEQTFSRPMPSSLDDLPRINRWLVSALARVHHGKLMIYLDGKHFECGHDDSMQAMIRIHRPVAMAKRGLLRGDLGFAESYIAGDWSTDDLSALLHLLLRNRENIGKHMYGQKLLRMGTAMLHKLRKNTLNGSRKNIEYHYDLGNDFYETWLDKSMTYSSALFDGTEDLEEAQTYKYQRILRELNAKPNQEILEIGCGWGGFAEEAVKAGHRVHGITLSKEQLEYAQERLACYPERAEFELRDYRHLDQQYDHIVSIEMFEAVGDQYWDAYFEILEKSLKPGGKAVLQIITIDDQHFESYRNRPDFIQRYIFPGGLLPSPEKLQQQIDKTCLQCTNTFSFGKDYAKTLVEWDRKFVLQQAKLLQLGYDDKFFRMWRYYLAYCEAGFNEQRIDVVQWTLEKP